LRKHAYYFNKEKRGENMAYTRGNSSQIIVGAAALFTYEAGPLSDASLPDLVDNESYKTTLSSNTNAANFRNVGYTSNGLEIQFQPDFGEVQVDQVLDVAKLYKQGMQVSLNTTFAESTLENLLFAVAGKDSDLGIEDAWAGPNPTLNMSAGDIGECPVERGLIAVGPGTGDCDASSELERIYVAYRALSIQNVSVAAKRDAATMFEVSFRLLPNDVASYGKIVDRTIPAA
jgi:hypothetical protein